MSSLLYIGPGIGAATIIIVIVVLVIVLLSLIMIIWAPIKRLFRKIKQRSSKK